MSDRPRRPAFRTPWQLDQQVGGSDPADAVELHPKWAPNIVTSLGRLGGRTVGVIANNPMRLGGCLDSPAAEKTSRFVRMCDAFGIPLRGAHSAEGDAIATAALLRAYLDPSVGAAPARQPTLRQLRLQGGDGADEISYAALEAQYLTPNDQIRDILGDADFIVERIDNWDGHCRQDGLSRRSCGDSAVDSTPGELETEQSKALEKLTLDNHELHRMRTARQPLRWGKTWVNVQVYGIDLTSMLNRRLVIPNAPMPAAGEMWASATTAKQFIAGILEHSTEMSPIINQWPNSYKRLMFGNEAPGSATWGVQNRSALVRVPTYRLTKEESRRVEIRSIDASMNPYLGYAVILAAGLRGIREGYELDEPAEDDVHQLTHRERRAMGYKDLPSSMDQALREFEKSEFMAEVLGEHDFEFFLRAKWEEWRDYQRQITTVELRNNLNF